MTLKDELFFEAPKPELALPPEPDYENLPNDSLKSILDDVLGKIKSSEDSPRPSDVKVKNFHEAQALKIQAIIDDRNRV